MTKVGLFHGMVRSLQNQAFPFNIFAMAEVAMDVPDELYYIETNANINVKNTSVIDSHIQNSKNWNCELNTSAL